MHYIILTFDRLMDEQNKDVGRKLGIATGLMFTLPFITYFACFHFVFQEKSEPSNWAGGAAVIVTNLIIGGYVVVAFNEPDPSEEEEQRGNDNDVLHPRTGVFKTRVD